MSEHIISKNKTSVINLKNRTGGAINEGNSTNIQNKNPNKANNKGNNSVKIKNSNNEEMLPDTKKKGLFDDIINHVGVVKLKEFTSQPCFVMPSTVRDNYHAEHSKFMKGVMTFSKLGNEPDIQYASKKQNRSFKNGMGQLISFFTFNPFFYWYRPKKKTWGGPIANSDIFTKNFITKFFYCMFKIFGSPLILLGAAIAIFIYFLKALNLVKIAESIGHAIFYIITFLLSFIGLTRPFEIATNMEREHFEKEGNSFNPKPIMVKRTPWFDPFIYLLGTLVPMHILGPYYGKNYGYGGISIIIIIFVALSYIIIFLGGINLLFLGGVFVFYFFKLIGGIKTSATGK